MAQSSSQAQPHESSLTSVREEIVASPRGALDSIGELASRRQASLWGDAWRRLIRNKLAVIGMVIVGLFALIAIFGPTIAPYGQNEVVDVRLARQHPSWTWPFGLDANGRDMFSRVMYGARVSLIVGVLAQVIVLAVGIPLGAIAG